MGVEQEILFNRGFMYRVWVDLYRKRKAFGKIEMDLLFCIG